MYQVDAIITCRWLLPVEPNGVQDNYAIIIKEGKIQDILPKDQVAENYSTSNIVHLDNHVVLPGLINMHTHSPMTLFRGLADDLPLMEWLTKHIWPAETKWLNNEFIQDGTRIAVAEMIKSGTTCFNEHFFFPEAMAPVVLEARIRACIGPTIINFPTNWSKDENEGFNKFLSIQKEFKDELLTWSLAPHSPYTTTDQILSKIAEYSKQHQLTIHMHVQETAHEVQESLEKYDKRPIKRLYDLGLLSHRFQAVHMTQIAPEDIDLLKTTSVNVTHCPESNLKLASGYCPVASLLKEHINVALGTDGAASNNDLNMMGEMRTAAFIGKTVTQDATAVSAIEAIRMATINGAKAMGLADTIGSIEIGKSADIIAIDLNHLNTMPVYNPSSHIVYSASSRQVTDVWVAGKQLLKNCELQTIDEEKLYALANKWQKRIRR